VPLSAGEGAGNRAKQTVGMEKGELQGEIVLLNLERIINVIVYWI
jgi:hypothetical protein